MTDRSIRPRYTILLLIALAGCATFKDTTQQEYAMPLLKECVGKFPGTWVNRVESDGRWWITYNDPNALYGVKQCMAEQYKMHPYLAWLKTRQASAQPSTTGTASATGSPAVVNVALPGAVTTVPLWKVGEEWQYAYQGPVDSGSFVWVVNRIETIDGEPHYVLKTGTREIFQRVSDLATTMERVDGVVVNRYTPPRLSFAWPLTVGKVWDQDFRQDLPVDRQINDRRGTWTVTGEETVTIPAGTFRTLRITWRNRNSGAVTYDMWYAPDVKQWVKIREVLSNGIREREMVSFKLK
jgi:hypothetical protein